MNFTVFDKARIIDPSRNIDEIGTVIINDGKIVAADGKALNQGYPGGSEIIDCSGKTIMPGLVDLRVFVGEPGAEHRETLQTASEAAAAGGVTSFVMMPDTQPVIDDVALVDFIARRARETSIVNVYPTAAITRGLKGKEITEFGLLTQTGAVALSDGKHSIENAAVMRRAMTYARNFDALIVHETQDRQLTGQGVMNEGLLASMLGLKGAPREAEVIVLERDLRLRALTQARYHAAQLSCAMSVQAVERAKNAGGSITAGVSINNLTLNENDIGDYRTFFRLSPVLRNEEDRLALIEALRNGAIDVIVSAHDPQDVDTKRVPFEDAESGAIGLETLLAAALRFYHDQSLSLKRLVEVLSTNPARLLNLEAGTLKKGVSADLIVVDLDTPWIVATENLRSKSKNTVFENAHFQGKVERTLVGGKTVYQARA